MTWVSNAFLISTEYETVGPSSFYKFELTTVTGDAVTSIETALYAVTTVETVVETEIEVFLTNIYLPINVYLYTDKLVYQYHKQSK